MNNLEKYIDKFAHLRVDRSKGAGAPHKPILLLSIIAEIEAGNILDNRIYLTPELVARFKDHWSKLVGSSIFKPNFSLPFFHLKSDGFWHLSCFVGKEIKLTSSNSIKSLGQLIDVIDYASLDESLYELLIADYERELLRNTLLDTYFNGRRIPTGNKIMEDISNQILNEPAVAYRKRAAYFDEEDVFVRGGVFKKEIPRIYDHTCCISGMRIKVSDTIQMIDACHIISFSESHDDTIGNGISLCPNLHRAFDRGLISIDENYKVLVKPFAEADTSYSIRQFEGKQILLPANHRHYPRQEGLANHQERFNFK